MFGTLVKLVNMLVVRRTHVRNKKEDPDRLTFVLALDAYFYK